MEILEHLGDLVGVRKLEAKPSQTTFKFTLNAILDFDVIIAKGTEIETKDGKYLFATDENCIIYAGSNQALVKGICTESGSAANGYDVGEINSILTPLSYIDEVSNVEISYGGEDEEDVENLRERIRLAPESFSNAGSSGAYRYHTLSSNQSIIDVSIQSPSAGVVDIYPLMKTGNPSPEVIQLVQDYFNQDNIRPLTDCVRVISPQKIDFNIMANLIFILIYVGILTYFFIKFFIYTLVIPYTKNFTKLFI